MDTAPCCDTRLTGLNSTEQAKHVRKVHCQACGEHIAQDEAIMSTLKGAYHRESPACRELAMWEAPAW